MSCIHREYYVSDEREILRIHSAEDSQITPIFIGGQWDNTSHLRQEIPLK
jgi:hypothetical protein